MSEKSNEELIAEVRELHKDDNPNAKPSDPSILFGPLHWCTYCTQEDDCSGSHFEDWPCHAIQLADRLETAQASLRAALDEVERLRKYITRDMGDLEAELELAEIEMDDND